MSRSRTEQTEYPRRGASAGARWQMPGAKAGLIAFSLIFLIGGLWAAGPDDLKGGFAPNWWPLTLAGLGVGIGFTALLFMIGEAGNFPSIKSFAKAELYELGASVLIVVIVVGALVSLGMMSKNILGGSINGAGAGLVGYCEESCRLYPVAGNTDPATCPAASDPAVKAGMDNAAATHPENMLYADADWFLGCMPSADIRQLELSGEGGLQFGKFGDKQYVFDQAQQAYAATNTPDGVGKSKGVMATHLMNIYINLFSLEFMLGPISTFGVSGYAPEALLSSISLDIAPNAGLTPISEATIMLTDLIGVGLGSVFMQKVLLQFIHQNGLALFLPLGLGFRGIPMLRKTGSTIVAAALVMYFVFPVSIWINQQVYASLQNPAHPVMQSWANYQTALQICQPLPGETAQQFRDRVQGQLAGQYQKDNKSLLDTISEILFGPSKPPGPSGEVDNSKTVTLPSSQQQSLWNSLKTNFGIIQRYVLNYAFALGPILPVNYFFEALVDEISNSMQWFALSLLFLVNTIIICVTLFRDLSLAMGGEPRIFGMGKLV